MGDVQHFWRQFAWTLVVSVVLLALCAGLGVLLTPPWSVQPLNTHLTVATDDTAIRAEGVDSPQEGTYRVRETPMRLTVSDGRQVDAILREPIGAPEGRPACEFVHGSGTGKASEAYGDIANAMASAGITTLVQDKRLDNYSALSRDYDANATDYLAGVQALRAARGVDAAKVGVYAESEGTWITTIMAKRDHRLAFTALVSAPVYSGRQQMAMAATKYLNIIGAPEGVKGIVPKVISMNFGPLGLSYADFDAGDYRGALTMPLLVVYGTRDPSMPIEQGAQQLLHDARAVGNDNALVRYYPTNHQIRTGSSLSEPGLPLAASYTHDLEDWVNAVAAGATADSWRTPVIAGAQPFQEFAVPTDIRPGPVRSFAVLILAFVFMLLMWIATVVLCFVAIGRRARSAPTSVDRRGRTLVHRFTVHTKTLVVANILITPIAVLGFLAYCAFTARCALLLQDHASQLLAGWNLLRGAMLVSIVMLGWLWVRMFFFYGPGNIDPESPKDDARMSRGHSAVIGCLSACVLAAIMLGAFFGLTG